MRSTTIVANEGLSICPATEGLSICPPIADVTIIAANTSEKRNRFIRGYSFLKERSSALIISAISFIYNKLESKKDRAVTLYRAGKIDDARWLTCVALQEARTPDEYLALANNQAMGERAAGNVHYALSIHILSAHLTREASNHFYIGNYYLGLANTYQRLGEMEAREDYTDKALIAYEAARVEYRKINDSKRLAMVVNNIAHLLIGLGRTDDALIKLFEARKTFQDETARQAEVDDTLAQAYLKLEDYKSAYLYSSKSISVLIDLEDEKLALSNSLETHGNSSI